MRRGRQQPRRGEIKETHGYPEPPEDLDHLAIKAWISCCEDLDSQGSLQKSDRKMIELFSRTYARMQRAELELGGQCLNMGTDDNPKINPLVKMVQLETARLQRILNDLRLSPVTRSKAVASTKDAESDHFEAILF